MVPNSRDRDAESATRVGHGLGRFAKVLRSLESWPGAPAVSVNMNGFGFGSFTNDLAIHSTSFKKT